MIYQNNYNRQYNQEQESSQSCSQCKRNVYKIQQENSESDDNAVIPLRKQIVQHNYQIQQNLIFLTKEIENLKRQNEKKDKIIRQLKFSVRNTSAKFQNSKHLHLSQNQNQNDYHQQLKQINRIRQELGCSPRNTFGNQKVFSSKNITSSRQRQQQKQYHTTNTQGYFQTKPNNKNFELKVALLQKEIRQYQLQIVQLKQRMTVYQGQFEWMNRFIHSFVKMCEQLSVNYGQLLSLQTFPIKKKTKVCWKYMKELISYFVKR